MSAKDTLNGIDISHHQSSLDLANVHADFVIVKATEGVGYTDPKFHEFANAAKRAGKLRGFYHFARADLDNTAESEADWFLAVAGPQLDDETILVLDWEAGSIKHGPGWPKVWLDRVKTQTGVTPLIYLSLSVTREYDWSTVATLYPLWLAAYGRNAPAGYKDAAAPTPGHWSAPVIFQYGSQGRLAGYPGDIDINRAYVNDVGWRALASKKGTNIVVGMISPAQGHVSSEWGRRAPIPGVTSGTFHAGIDIANKTGTPIYAAFAGVIVAVGWNIVAGRSGIAILIQNPDGEYEYYGHLSKARVRKGQAIAAGQRIADMGATGNVTGPHLHFEVWSSYNKTRNPRIDFRYFGLSVGSKPKRTKPAKPAETVKPSKGNAKIRAYQERQNKYGNAGLFVDGKNGAVTKAWKKWVKQCQIAMRSWRGVSAKLLADGDYAGVTHGAALTLQRRNKLYADGFIDTKTIRFMRAHGSHLSYRPDNRP